MLIKGWLVLLFSAVSFSYFSRLAVSGSFSQKKERKKVKKRSVCSSSAFDVVNLRLSNHPGPMFYEQSGPIPRLKTKWGVLPFEVCIQEYVGAITKRWFGWSIDLSPMSRKQPALIMDGYEKFYVGESLKWNRCFLLTPCMIYKALGDIANLTEADMEKMTILFQGQAGGDHSRSLRVVFRDVPFLTRTKPRVLKKFPHAPLFKYNISDRDAEKFEWTRQRIVEYKDGSLPTCIYDEGLDSTNIPDRQLLSGRTEFLIFGSNSSYYFTQSSRSIQPKCPPRGGCPCFSQASKLNGKEVSEVEQAY